MANAPAKAVTFILSTGQFEVRLTDNSVNAMCDAAKTLKARYFVAADGWDNAQNCPIWGVFDMRKAMNNNPVRGRGQWCVTDPVKTYTTETPDAAIMWALSAGQNR